MLYNYLKIAIRNVLKHRLFSFINVFGLSFSLATAVIIIMLLADQYSYDAFNSDADRIYRINHTRSDIDNIIAGMATSPMPLGEELMANYPGVDGFTRLYRGFGNDWIKLMQDVNIPLSGFFADPNVFEMFQYELEFGDPQTALLEPYSVVITKATADKLFRQDNPIGEVIEVGELGSYKITGVLKPLKGKSHIKFDGLASIASVPSLVRRDVLSTSLDQWTDRNRGWTYIKLQNGSDISSVEESLANISHQQYDDIENMDATFYLQNIREINPGPLMGNQIGPGMPMVMVWFLVGLAFVVIISSTFNYTNLSIARSLGRAREVGVRKIFGAIRRQIFLQFLIESVVVAFLAFGFSIVIVHFLRPVFLNLNFSQLLDFDLQQSTQVYALSLGFALIVGALAGVLPASFHSSVKAIQGLKKLSGVKVFSRMGLRRFLIVLQFSLSLFLVITVRLIYDQMSYMMDKEYGFNSDNNVVIQLRDSPRDLLITELEKYPSLQSVASAGFTPASGTSSTNHVEVGDEDLEFNFHYVDENYMDNMDLRLLAGNNFNPTGYSKNVILNQQAVEKLGYETNIDAVGQVIKMRDDSVQLQVIGVVEDYHHETLFSEIKPLILQYDPEQFNILQVKINSGNYQIAIEDIEKAWASVNPSLQIEYKLLSEEIAFFAEMMFGDMTKIIAFISFLAIVISCLGLLGMVVFSTQSRIREVSIRKVLGASSKLLVMLLSRGFLIMLSIAILITTPLAWLINDFWLNFIAYRVEIGWDVLVFSVFVVASLGIIVIGSQTLRTANTNPVNTLRDE